MKFAFKSYKRMNSGDGAKSRMRIAFALAAVLLFSAFATSTVHASGEQSITRTIQPSSADSYMNEGAKTTNYGGASDIFVASWPTAWGNARGIIKFDLSGIPQGSTITSATLSLYLYDTRGFTRTYGVHRVDQTKNWGESTVTWNKYDGTNDWTTGGGDYEATASATASAGASWPVWVDWSSSALASDVSNFVNTPSTNFGWIIKDAVEGSANLDWVRFRSNNYATASLRPKLEVTYTAPWDSHKTSYTDPICDNFANYASEHTVYMNGTGFKQGTYNVVYWDGGGNKRSAELNA